MLARNSQQAPKKDMCCDEIGLVCVGNINPILGEL